jgi:hypothetical protein
VYEPQDFFVDSDWYDQAMWGGRAAGAIAASGRVIECERGFRAEYAEPVALLEFEIASDDRNWLRELADTYQVPVLPRRELVEYARWRGELGIPVCRDG